MSESNGSFWSSLPGVLTGIAAVITAVAGLVAVWPSAGETPATTAEQTVAIEPQPTPESNPPAVVTVESTVESNSTKDKPLLARPVAERVVANISPAVLTMNKPIDCSESRFQPIRDKSVKEMLDTANFYRTKLLEGERGSNMFNRQCQKYFEYQGRAWCQSKEDAFIRDGLLKAMRFCRVK